MGMLDRGNARVGPDGIGPRHIPYVIEGSWKGFLQGSYVLDRCDLLSLMFFVEGPCHLSDVS